MRGYLLAVVAIAVVLTVVLAGCPKPPAAPAGPPPGMMNKMGGPGMGMPPAAPPADAAPAVDNTIPAPEAEAPK